MFWIPEEVPPVPAVKSEDVAEVPRVVPRMYDVAGTPVVIGTNPAIFVDDELADTPNMIPAMPCAFTVRVHLCTREKDTLG